MEVELEMSWVESNSFEIDSIKISKAKKLTQVWYEHFFSSSTCLKFMNNSIRLVRFSSLVQRT